MYGNFTHMNTVALSLSTFLDTIDRKFFTPNFGTYEHMTFFNDPTSFKVLVIGLYLGIVLASLMMFYNRRVLGGFVRKLDSENATDPDSAKTLSELGYEKNIFIKLSLKMGYSLRRVICFAPGDGENSARTGGNLANTALTREKVMLDADKFFLPEEKRDTTLRRFRTKGSGPLSIVLTAVLGIVVVVLIFKLAPLAVSFLESFVAGFSNEPDVLS